MTVDKLTLGLPRSPVRRDRAPLGRPHGAHAELPRPRRRRRSHAAARVRREGGRRQVHERRHAGSLGRRRRDRQRGLPRQRQRPARRLGGAPRAHLRPQCLHRRLRHNDRRRPRPRPRPRARLLGDDRRTDRRRADPSLAGQRDAARDCDRDPAAHRARRALRLRHGAAVVGPRSADLGQGPRRHPGFEREPTLRRRRRRAQRLLDVRRRDDPRRRDPPVSRRSLAAALVLGATASSCGGPATYPASAAHPLLGQPLPVLRHRATLDGRPFDAGQLAGGGRSS